MVVVVGGGVRTKFSVQLWSQAEQLVLKKSLYIFCFYGIKAEIRLSSTLIVVEDEFSLL